VRRKKTRTGNVTDRNDSSIRKLMKGYRPGGPCVGSLVGGEDLLAGRGKSEDLLGEEAIFKQRNNQIPKKEKKRVFEVLEGGDSWDRSTAVCRKSEKSGKG